MKVDSGAPVESWSGARPALASRLLGSDIRARLLALTVAALLIALVYLLYVNVQLSLRLSRAAVDDFESVTRLPLQDGAARFYRDSGAGRPQILAADDHPLLELDDLYSTIFVDGGSNNLWQYPHSYAFDADRKRLYHSIRGPVWELQKVISAEDPTRLRIELYFMALGPDLRRVDLLLNHYHRWLREVRRQPDGFVALVPAGTQAEVERGVNTQAAYEVTVRAVEGLSTRAAEPVRLGFSSQYGVSNAILAFALSEPVFNQRVRLGVEEITWRRLP